MRSTTSGWSLFLAQNGGMLNMKPDALLEAMAKADAMVADYEAREAASQAHASARAPGGADAGIELAAAGAVRRGGRGGG